VKPGRGARAGPALLALATLAVHAAAWDRYGVFRDELYFISCGRRLSLGYVDQPPLVALAARLAHGAFGLWVPGLRLVPWLASAATVYATGRLAVALGAGAAGAALASAAVLSAPLLLGLGHYLTMNAFEPLLFVLLAWTLVRIAAGGDPRLWLAAGALVGVGLENKYSMALYAGALVAALLATPERRVALVPWAAGGALLAAAIAAPNLAWQAAHGFPFLELVKNGQLHKNAPFRLGGFLLAQVTDLNPMNALLWLPGLAALLLLPSLRPFRFLGLGFVLLAAAEIASRAKPYYLAPAVPPLLAAGACALEARLGGWPFKEALGARATWLVALPAAALLASGAILLPMALPVLPRERFAEYQEGIGVGPQPTERHALGRLPQIYADQHGWRELALGVASAVARLPADERARAVVFARNYGEASAIELFGEGMGLPPVVSPHNQWFLWGVPPGRDVVVVVSDAKEDCGGSFRSKEVLWRMAPSPWVMPYEDERVIWACRGPLRPLAEIWAAARLFI